MENRIIPFEFQDFSLIDSQLPNIFQRFHADMARMDHEMDNFRSQFLGPNNQQVASAESSLICQDGNNKVLKLTFDVRQFKPEEVTVETKNDKLVVYAKHVETTDTKNVFNEYKREFSLPQGIDTSSIKITLSNDGVLIAIVPLAAHQLEAVAN